MKKVFSLILVLALSLVLTSAALAEVPAPGGPFNSAFRVQNLETTSAGCSYKFYDAAGNTAYTSALETVLPGDSLFVYVGNLELGSGSYSGVVSCDRQVAAVSNFSDEDSGASYSGIAAAGTTWYAPGVYDNYWGFYSNIVVQNASAGPVDITVEYFAPGNPVAVASETAPAVPANAAVSFEQEGNAILADNVFYAAKITGTGNVAPVVNIYGAGGYAPQLYSYNPFTSGSTTAYAPIIMNYYYGFDTSLIIQNITANPAEVTVLYTNGKSQSFPLPGNTATSLYTPAQDCGGTACLNVGDIVGAKVTSTQPVVVLVNQSGGLNRASSYVGFAESGSEVREPIVFKNYYGWNSAVQCQNVGTSATTMTIQYFHPVTSGSTTSPSINPGVTHLFYQPNDPALASAALNYIASAKVTASQPIVCIVNYDQNMEPDSLIDKDAQYSYNGIIP